MRTGCDPGRVAQYFHGLMFPAFGQKQSQRSIHLLIQQLCSVAHAGVRNLAQALFPMVWSIDLPAGAGNPQLRYSALSRLITCLWSLLTVR